MVLITFFKNMQSKQM